MHSGTTALLPFPILPWRKRIAVLLFLLGWLASNDLSSHSGLLGALISDSVLNCQQRMRSLLCLPLKTDPCQQRAWLSLHWIGGFLQISSLRIRSKLYQISPPLVFPAPAPAPHLGLHWQRDHPCFHQPVNSISGWREVKESNREEKHFLPFQPDMIFVTTGATSGCVNFLKTA